MKVTVRNRDRISIDLKKDEIEKMLFVLRIVEAKTTGELEAFVHDLWDFMRPLPESQAVIDQLGDM